MFGGVVAEWLVRMVDGLDFLMFLLVEKLKARFLNGNLVELLIRLTNVGIPADVQGNAAAALGNLFTNSTHHSKVSLLGP